MDQIMGQTHIPYFSTFASHLKCKIIGHIVQQHTQHCKTFRLQLKIVIFHPQPLK